MYLIPVHLTNSFVLAVIAIYLPVMVRYLGYSASLVGIILAISEGAGILGPFLICRFTDRNGKYKQSLIFSAILSALPALPLALLGQPLLSAVFVAIIAVGYRSSTPLIEAITTINVGKSGNYGKIRVFGSIGFVAFSLFMQWVPILKRDGPLNIALWIVITSIFSIAVISFLPSQSINVEPRNAEAPVGDSPHNKNKKSIWTSYFILGLICIALNRLAMAPIYSFLSLFMVEYMHWDAVGIIWAVGSTAEIPFLYISHHLIRRFGSMPVLVFTSVMAVLRLLLYAVFPFKAGIIFAQLLHSFCFGLFHPAAVTFISESVPLEKRSFGMTIYLSLGNGLPLLVGNFAGGFIVEYLGFRSLFGTFLIFPLLSVLIYFAGRFKGIFGLSR